MISKVVTKDTYNPSPIQSRLLSLISRLRFNKLLHSLDSSIRATGKASQNLAVLIDSKDAPDCSLGLLLESDFCDQRGTSVAEKRIGQVLLGFESGIRLGRVR